MGAKSISTKVIPCYPTHGDGHASSYEGNHRDYNLPHFSVKLHPFCGAVSYHFFFSLFLSLVALWHLNENILCPETLFVPGHLLLLPRLILLHLTSGSVMIKPVRTFQRTSHDEAFIQNAKLFYQTFLILTFPLSSTVGVGSHYVASRSLVLL